MSICTQVEVLNLDSRTLGVTSTTFFLIHTDWYVWTVWFTYSGYISMSAGTTTAPPGHWYPSAQQPSPSPPLIIPPPIKSNMEEIWQRRKQADSRLSKEGQPEHPLFCSVTRCPSAKADSRNPTEELAQEYMLDYTLALAGSPHQGPRSTIVTECYCTPLQSPGVRVALV